MEYRTIMRFILCEQYSPFLRRPFCRPISVIRIIGIHFDSNVKCFEVLHHLTQVIISHSLCNDRIKWLFAIILSIHNQTPCIVRNCSINHIDNVRTRCLKCSTWVYLIHEQKKDIQVLPTDDMYGMLWAILKLICVHRTTIYLNIFELKLNIIWNFPAILKLKQIYSYKYVYIGVLNGIKTDVQRSTHVSWFRLCNSSSSSSLFFSSSFFFGAFGKLQNFCKKTFFQWESAWETWNVCKSKSR